MVLKQGEFFHLTLTGYQLRLSFLKFCTLCQYWRIFNNPAIADSSQLNDQTAEVRPVQNVDGICNVVESDVSVTSGNCPIDSQTSLGGRDRYVTDELPNVSDKQYPPDG